VDIVCNYCQAGCVIKTGKGEPFTFELQACDGRKKCAEECPCGTIDLS
jgi:MinD superfamily P-loop ATPase